MVRAAPKKNYRPSPPGRPSDVPERRSHRRVVVAGGTPGRPGDERSSARVATVDGVRGVGVRRQHRRSDRRRFSDVNVTRGVLAGDGFTRREHPAASRSIHAVHEPGGTGDSSSTQVTHRREPLLARASPLSRQSHGRTMYAQIYHRYVPPHGSITSAVTCTLFSRRSMRPSSKSSLLDDPNHWIRMR